MKFLFSKRLNAFHVEPLIYYVPNANSHLIIEKIREDYSADGSVIKSGFQFRTGGAEKLFL